MINMDRGFDVETWILFGLSQVLLIGYLIFSIFYL